MKFFIFLFLFLSVVKNAVGDSICPIIKTIIRAESVDKKKIVDFCDFDDYYRFTFGSKENPEIILYKKSHEINLKIPVRGTELEIIDGTKRYTIRDRETGSYIVLMDDTKDIVVFTELNIEDAGYINRAYVLLDKGK